MLAIEVEWVLNAGDLVFFLLGATGGAAITRFAAVRRLHVETRVKVLEWATANAHQDFYSANLGEVRIERDGKRSAKGEWSVFEHFEDTVAMLPLLDRLAFHRLETWVTNVDRDRYPNMRVFGWNDYKKFAQMRIRVSIAARLWVAWSSLATYKWALGHRLASRRHARSVSKRRRRSDG